MTKQVDFNTLFCSPNILKISGSNMIVAADSNSDSLAIATDAGYPVLLDLKRESLKTFQNPKNNKFSTPTSIAINQNSKIIITGHADGSVCVFSVDENYTLITTFKDLHKQAITAIGFAPKNEDFYVGDISGLTTKVSFGKIISKSFSEKEINRDSHPVIKILFTKESFVFEVGIVVMTDHFILLDPTKSNNEQVTGRSGNFVHTPSVLFYEGAHKNIDVYAFSGNECHYYTLGNAGFLNYSGSTIIFKNSKEYTTNAMIWNSKMIAITTSYSISRFINIKDIGLTIERRIKNYEESVVQRNQTPLSQAIISESIYTMSNNEYLYCILSQKVIKMNYTSWHFMVTKYVKDKNWEEAFMMIIKASKYKEIDAIGLSNRISEQNLSIKQLAESVVTQYIRYALDSGDEDIINTSFRDCVRMSSIFSIQKFVVSEMLPIIQKTDYTKEFYSTIFRNRKQRSNDYITPDFVKDFLKFCQKSNDLNFAEKCLMKVKIPKNYANDIASIIYEFGLTGTFSKIMVFSFSDFITPCIIMQDDFDKFKTYLSFIYSDDVMSLRQQMAERMKSINRMGSLRDLESSLRGRRNKKKEVDWDELDGRNKFRDLDDDDRHGHMRGIARQISHKHSNDLGYAEKGMEDEEDNKKGPRFGRREIDPKEEEKRRQLRILARRTICLWLFCPTNLLGFARLSQIIQNDLELATTILDKCSDLLPLKLAPNSEFTHSDFADSVMQVLNQQSEGDNIQYEKFLPILNIICPLYAQPEVTITRCALRLTTQWCFHCIEVPQSTRIEVINKVRSKYPTLMTEELFMEYSTAAGFRFAVESKYLSQKRYDILISSMICDPEDRSNILEFLLNHKEDKEEIKKAILANIDGLTLIDSDSLFTFVLGNFNELNEQIISTLKKPLNRYLYFRSFLELDPDNAKPYLDEFFELICKFNPSGATLFFQENSKNLDVMKAKESCRKYGVSDCFVIIAKENNDQEEAIKSVERAIIDALETEGIEKISVTSETQLGQYPPLVSTLNAIDALLQYQGETMLKEGKIADESEDNFKFLKELKFFRAFDFPFYISRQKDASVRKILFLLFTHFIIGSMDYVPVKALFRLLLVHLSQFDFQEIRTILMQLSDQIEFKVRLSDSVLQMFAEDACHLLDEVFKYTTNGRKTSVNACCAGCLKPLSPPQYKEVLIYPCGHMFHFELECVRTMDNDGKVIKPDECPICCKGEISNETLEVQVPAAMKKLANSKMKMLLRRLDFALKRNYGADMEGYRPSSVYFSAEGRDVADGVFTPQKISLVKPIPVTIKK